MTNNNNELLTPEEIEKNKSSESNNLGKEKIDKDEVIKKLLERVERLEKTSNKKRLENYDRLNDENPETIYKLRTIDSKVIINWSDLKFNKAEVDPVTRKIIENQTLDVFYEDGKKESMSLVMFNRRYEYIYTKLIEETILKKAEDREKYGNRIFKVETTDGSVYSIGEKFIN